LIVVCDASPLISLSAIGQFELLHQLYGEIYIPEAVGTEVLGAGLERPGTRELREAEWVHTCSVENDFLVRALEGELDQGEAQAVALAVELNADLLLVDERRGRGVAQRFGIKVIGVLGILVEAKKKGLILEVRPALDDLLTKAGFRITSALYNGVLRAADESSGT
jgi:predicted nucleic acid-binding protein